MAFNPAPTSIWSGYTSDGTNISIPIAALQGLTVAEADTVTGDWRAICLSFCATLYQHYYSLAIADRPQAMVAMTPFPQAITSGDFAGDFKITYQFAFYGTIETPDISPEP